MSTLKINPFEYFTDTDGKPLDAGYIYIGVANLDPETNPIDVFYDAALTIPVTQPVRTVNGYVLNGGAPASLYAATNYSIRVRNKNFSQVYYVPDFSTLDTSVTLASATGSSLIGFIQSGFGAVATTIMKWLLRQNVSLHDFMTDEQIADSRLAVPVLDHTAAIQAWLAQMVAYRAYTLPFGTFRHSELLIIPSVSGVKIIGSGRRTSIFSYFGAATTGDLLTYGNGTTPLTGASFRGFSLKSETVKTAGAAFRIRRVQNGSEVLDVSCGTLNGDRNLWDGIWFDNVNVCKYDGGELNVAHQAFACNGSAVNDEGSDLIVDNITVVGGVSGYLVGGGIGGVYFGRVLAYGCERNFIIDNSRAARLNREILYSDQCVSDGCQDMGFYINDTFAGGSNISLNAFIGSAGRIGTGGSGIGIYVQNYPNSRITMGAGQLFNCTSHGMLIDDASTIISIDDARQISNNAGWGLYASVLTTNIVCKARMFANTLGNISSMVYNDPWASMPTVLVAQTGTIGAYSGSTRYKLNGSTLHFIIDATCTTVGTATNGVYATMPTQMKGFANGTGKAIGVSGKTLTASATNPNQLYITNYDNTGNVLRDGEIVTISGTCEVF